MQRISTQVIPPRNMAKDGPVGWAYPQEVNGRIQWVPGETYDNLIKELTGFRISNQLILGNPEKDIIGYYCAEFPNLCFRAGEEQPEVPRPRSFRERVALWAKLRYSRAGDIKLVEQGEADRRASICQQCPANQEWRDGCAPCVAHVDRTLLLIRQNRKPSLAVLGCAIAGHDNSCATMMPEEMLRHREKYMGEVSNTQLPSICWMREL